MAMSRDQLNMVLNEGSELDPKDINEFYTNPQIQELMKLFAQGGTFPMPNPGDGNADAAISRYLMSASTPMSMHNLQQPHPTLSKYAVGPPTINCPHAIKCHTLEKCQQATLRGDLTSPGPLQLGYLDRLKRTSPSEPTGWTVICEYCATQNGADASHTLRDQMGNISCPLYGAILCCLCQPTPGRQHTLRQCPHHNRTPAPM